MIGDFSIAGLPVADALGFQQQIAPPERRMHHTGEEYRDKFLDLLPLGSAWNKYENSVLWTAIYGFAEIWGNPVDIRASDLLEVESDPRQTYELLSDWERNFGLPDSCFTKPQTVAQRQAALVERMTMLGGQSRQFFINYAAQLGFNIAISEFRPFMLGFDRCGDNRVFGDGTNPMLNDMFVLGYLPVYDPNGKRIARGEISEQPCFGLATPETRFWWQVHVHSIPPNGNLTDIQCILERWKPAHTQIVYDYSIFETLLMRSGLEDLLLRNGVDDILLRGL